MKEYGEPIVLALTNLTITNKKMIEQTVKEFKQVN